VSDACAITSVARRSLDLLNQLARLPHEVPQLPAFLDRFPRIQSILQRVFVAAWSARSQRTAVHPTTFLSGDGRRHAGFTRARFRTAAQARQHRRGITRMIDRHFFVAITQIPRPFTRMHKTVAIGVTAELWLVSLVNFVYYGNIRYV
jgi:hypothetical protein